MIRPINKKKYIIKILMTIFFYISISLSISSLNTIGIYTMYFLPFMIIPLAISVYLEVKKSLPKRQIQNIMITLIIIPVLICIPVFLSIFLLIFHPTQSLSFYKINNCQVKGIAKMSQPSFDVYSILYIDFEYKNKNLLGYACMSDQTRNSQSYTFIYKGDYIPYDEVGDSFSEKYKNRRLLNKNIISTGKQQKRILRQRGYNKMIGKTVQSVYNFSEVKIPSWMCVNSKIDFEELNKSKTCYVNFFKNKQDAYNNSQNRLNLKEVSHFALVSFDEIPYYPKAGYYCLIIFTYLPILLIFYPLSSYITHQIFELYSDRKNYKII